MSETDMRKRPELLAPAGDMERLHMAVLYGADAVYLAGTRFGMRAAADNLTLEELNEAIGYAHALGKKVYITGKGRCNVTNNCSDQEVLQNVPRNPRLLYSDLRLMNPFTIAVKIPI